MLHLFRMDTSVAVYPSTVISGGDTNMQGDDLRTEEPLSMKEMDIIKSLDRYIYIYIYNKYYLGIVILQYKMVIMYFAYNYGILNFVL